MTDLQLFFYQARFLHAKNGEASYSGPPRNMGDWNSMDTLLIILGTVGITAIMLSAYIFTVAARTYVSEQEAEPAEGLRSGGVDRRSVERRSGYPVSFPLRTRGHMLEAERRRRRDRRDRLSH
jgi:hypothetical protein